jgi:acetylglutamate kinase
MRVKIDTCIQALKNGVLRTHIINGRTIDSLLIEIFTGMGSGTMITELKEADIYTQQEKIKQ